MQSVTPTWRRTIATKTVSGCEVAIIAHIRRRRRLVGFGDPDGPFFWWTAYI